jgi:hypothetical protein
VLLLIVFLADIVLCFLYLLYCILFVVGNHMYFELFDIFLLSLVCLVIYAWISAQKVRESALVAATDECKRLDLQLLDGNVGLKRFRVKRGNSGSLVLNREYGFEFSATGEERYQGKVVMLGLSIEEIYLQPHRIVNH